jgi:hypothetical protein
LSHPIPPTKKVRYQGIYGVLLTGLLIFIAYHLYHYHNERDPWILGDWLIHYEDGGFKRRGLSGSLLFILQDFTGISLPKLVYGLQLLGYALFFALVFKIVQNKQPSYLLLIMFFSPVTLLFLLNDSGGHGRKEIILLVLFALSAYWHTRKKYTNLKHFMVLASLSFFTFWHEIMAFYMVPFIHLHHSHQPSRPLWKTTIEYLIALGIPLLSLTIWGTEINNGMSYTILNERGVYLEGGYMMGGIFGWSIDGIDFILQGRKTDYLTYLLPLVYGMALVGFVFKKEIHKKDVLAIGLSFIPLLPLFYLGVDWGRWLFIQFTLMTLLFTSRINHMEQPSIAPLHPTSNRIMVMIGASHLLWHMPSFGKGFKMVSIFTKAIIESIT